jgi:hypothetical protein
MTRISSSELAVIEARLEANRRPAVATPPAPPRKTPTSNQRNQEKAMHEQFEALCRHANIHTIHFRTDRKSPIPGMPDFTCHAAGKCCFVEFKIVGVGVLSDDQKDYIKALRAQGNPVLVAFDVADAFRWTKEQLFK